MKLTPLAVALLSTFSFSTSNAAPSCGDGGQLCFEKVKKGQLDYIKAWNQYIELWVVSEPKNRITGHITEIYVSADGKSDKKLILSDSLRGVYFSQRVDTGAPDDGTPDVVEARFNRDNTLIDIYMPNDQPGKFRTVDHYTLHADEKLLGFYKTWQKKKSDSLVSIGEVSMNFFALDHSSSYSMKMGIDSYKEFNPGAAPVSATGHLFNTGKDYNDKSSYSQPSLYPKYLKLWDAKHPTDPPNKETLDYRGIDWLSSTDPYYFFETKYSYAGNEEFHTGHGYWGSKLPEDMGGRLPADWYWLIPQAARETMTGGPFKQELRGSQLVLLSGHFVSGEPWPISRSNPQTKISGTKWSVDNGVAKSKILGPFFVGFSTAANDADEARNKFIHLRERANEVAEKKIHKFWGELNYDEHSNDTPPLFIPHNRRGSVYVNLDYSAKNKFIFPTDWSDQSAIYILSDEGRPSSASTGYQYWGYPGEDGALKFSNVRAGTYRLSAYIRGTYGSYIRDGVVVKEGETTHVRDLFPHHYFGSVKTVFKIGTPDFSPAEFKYGSFPENSVLKGKPARQFPYYGNSYWSHLKSINYTFSTPNLTAASVPSTFWGKDAGDYVPLPGNTSPEPWKFKFSLTEADLDAKYAVFSLNLASHFNGSVLIYLNGGSREYRRWSPTDQGCNSMIRSGMGGCPASGIFVIPMRDLKKGENILAIQGSGEFQLDAMKLELTNQDLGSLHTQQPHSWRDIDLFLADGSLKPSNQYSFGN